MSSEMKITGAAPLIAIPTFLYLILAIIFSYNYKSIFTITQEDNTFLLSIGVFLLLIGIVMVVNCARKLLDSFKNEKLMKDGLYKIFRDPMYAAYLIFIIPSISFLFNSWLALTTVIINYALYSFFIRTEHKYLEENMVENMKVT